MDDELSSFDSPTTRDIIADTRTIDTSRPSNKLDLDVFWKRVLISSIFVCSSIGISRISLLRLLLLLLCAAASSSDSLIFTLYLSYNFDRREVDAEDEPPRRDDDEDDAARDLFAMRYLLL